MDTKMGMYIVYNGYTGFDALHVICVARSEEHAKTLAQKQFHIEAHTQCEYLDETKSIYSEDYWTNLTAELICDDISNGCCSEVMG